MRILLDTNILIHREAKSVIREDIGILFRWIDQLQYEKCIHSDSIKEIEKHADENVVRTLSIKLGNYNQIKTRARDIDEIAQLRENDRSRNDEIDTNILAELAAERVSAIITEDRGIHKKASLIGLDHFVFTIDGFLEKVTAENPDLVDYPVLAVRKVHFGELDINSDFFDSFRRDYPGFNDWFNRKADEEAYVANQDDGSIAAFLYLKREGMKEDYSDITPQFRKGRRLKIGTFKVVANGIKLGERFLKIIFDNALLNRVDQIYVTLYRHTEDHDRLALLLEDWGFLEYGTKASQGGEELVMIRDFHPNVDTTDPRKTFPFLSATARKFIVPIYPEYHQELLPDSLLQTEDPEDVADSRSHRNALNKVYISRSIERDLRPGDVIIFYRTKPKGASAPAHHVSVVTTIGVVLESILNLRTEESFIAACRKRSVFSDEELLEHWNHKRHNRPFVVNFLYVHSFKRRPNLRELKDIGALTNHPRGFEQLSDEAFNNILIAAEADDYIIVD